MKKRFLALVVTVCILAGTYALAGPPPITQIPDTATWAIHVDVEALQASTVAKGAMTLITAEGSPVPAKEAAMAKDVWRLLADVKGLTVYGSSFSPTDAILLASHKCPEADLRKLAGITDQTPATKYGKHTIYTLSARHQPVGDGLKRFGCFYSPELVVAGGDLNKVKMALDLLDGKGKALGSDNALVGMLVPAKGSVILAAATNMDRMRKAIAARRASGQEGKDDQALPRRSGGGVPHAGLLLRSQSARAEIGELQGNVFASLRLMMASEDDAQNVSLVIQGVRAAMLLQTAGREGEENTRNLRKIVRAIKVVTDGRGIDIAFDMSADDLLRLADNMMRPQASGPEKPAAEPRE